ncbi:hypothetical protein HID58_049145 [Brassica napus]|uniref:Uncharacterized protein n=1 Tax=Brassica napus TaxID=3708 RepID=A0ABQ8B459_BRANA|nr:hypothetical protein HID58_049145 [Brassica napus]
MEGIICALKSTGFAHSQQAGISSSDPSERRFLCRGPSLGSVSSDVVHPVSFIGEVVAKLGLGVPKKFCKDALRHSRVWDEISFFGNVVRRSVSIIYDEYQKAKTRKRRPFYTPLPRLVRAASSVSGPSFVPPVRTEAPPLVSLPWPHGLRGMAFHRDQSVLRARATTRWELMKERLEEKVDHWNPEEEYRHYLLWAEGADQMMTGGPVQAATSGSAAGSRYLGDPTF